MTDLGIINTSSTFAARDCGYTANYGGRSVWVFGDTFLTLANENNLRLLSNSWSYTHDTDAGDGIAALLEESDTVGAPKQLIGLTEEERLFNARHFGQNCLEPPCDVRWAIWPGAVIVHPKGNPAYIFYHKVKVAPGYLNFHEVGHSLAVWASYPELPERPHFKCSRAYPTLMFPDQEDVTSNGFGSAALLIDNTLYVYGCEFDEETFASPCVLARVDIDSILDKTQWLFFVGGGEWSSELGAAIPVFDGSTMSSVFYSSYIGRYIAVYSKPVSVAVMYRTAENPEGPWSAPQKLFDAETPVGSEIGWVYDALVHPSFSQDNDRIIYVTYSRATGALSSEFRLVAVELGLSI